MARSRRRHKHRRPWRGGLAALAASHLGELVEEFSKANTPHKIVEQRALRHARESRRSRGRLRQRIHELEYQLGTLMLLNRTLIQVLKERPDWNEARFAELLKEIDLEDGKLDDRAPAPQKARQANSPDGEPG